MNLLASPLSPRETQVLHLLFAGCSNRQIAQRLEVSGHTVKFHLGNLYEKLGAQHRTEAVVRAVHAGLDPVLTRRGA